MKNPTYIWVDAHGQGRNRYVLFRREFKLDEAPDKAMLKVFADTRYRLIINGKTVCHGPARFFPEFPMYDELDVALYLQGGQNVIAVMVNSYGCGSFHSVLNRGGLILECIAGDMAIGTDKNWTCLESPGHNPVTQPLSFALNPGEHLSLAKMPAGWTEADFDDSDWQAAVEVDGVAWGPLRPRNLALLDESPIRPPGQPAMFAAAPPHDQVHSLAVVHPEPVAHGVQALVAVKTFIHAPDACSVTLGAWWGRYWLNGEEIKGNNREDVHLRQDFAVSLKAGWNTLVMCEIMRSEVWDFYLALPEDAALTIAAEADLDADDAFLVGGPWIKEQMKAAEDADLSGGELPAALGEWQKRSRGQGADLPVRERAWKTFRAIRSKEDLKSGESLALLFDFEQEYLGRVRLDFTAASGTTVDVSYGERLHDDGGLNVHGRFLVDMVERCRTGAGRQELHLMHPRGGRYVELLVSGDTDKFELHDFDLTGACYPVSRDASFECSEPRLQEIWEIGRQATHKCMEDAFLDCPWRERGVYIGDALVEFDAALAAFGDTRVMRRSIEIFLHGQGENGLVPGGAFGITPGKHPDYSAILLMCARRYIEVTGDTSIVSDYVDRWERLLEGLVALKTSGGALFDGTDLHPYIDIAQHDCRKSVNCALNCFFQKAFIDGAVLLDTVDRDGKNWSELADATAAAIRALFWDETRGVFVDRLREEVPDTEPSIHGNALAVMFEIATPEQCDKLKPWFREAMADNFFGKDRPDERNGVRTNAYFSYYALDALYRLDCPEDALSFMSSCWGMMLDCGAWTTWESFSGENGGSLCHAWAASPTWYLTKEVLGVAAKTNAPDTVIVAPKPSGLEWAKGTYLHPKGPVRVEWKQTSDGLDVKVDAPDGVTVERG